MLIHRQIRMRLAASDAAVAVKRRTVEAVNKVKVLPVYVYRRDKLKQQNGEIQ
jgi:hypothetical protein